MTIRVWSRLGTTVVLAAVTTLYVGAAAAVRVSAAQPATTARGAACSPGLHVLPGLRDDAMLAFAFNREHTTIGWAMTPSGTTRAVYWDAAGIHRIPTGRDPSQAHDINDAGVIVGQSGPNMLEQRAWVFVGGRLHQLQGLGGISTRARRINASGEIVGSAFDASFNQFAIVWRHWWSKPAQLLPPAGYSGSTGLTINDAGFVAGRTRDAQGVITPVVWDPSGQPHVLPVPGGDFVGGNVYDMTDTGRAVGTVDTATDGVVHGGVWARGTVQDLGVLPGDDDTELLGTARTGRFAVGVSFPDVAAPITHPVFWPGSGPLLTLPGLTSDYSSQDTAAFEVDNHGTVVGFSVDAAGQQHAVYWTCAPALAYRP
jgi:uncharacterized membrane protein